MGLYIKGAKMPEYCLCCPCVQYEQWEGRFYICAVTDKELSQGDMDTKRPDWCPLVEVQTPHGRLIDADALEDMDIEICDTDDGLRIKERVAGRNHMRQIIKVAPTIIPAEED